MAFWTVSLFSSTRASGKKRKPKRRATTVRDRIGAPPLGRKKNNRADSRLPGCSIPARYDGVLLVLLRLTGRHVAQLPGDRVLRGKLNHPVQLAHRFRVVSKVRVVIAEQEPQRWVVVLLLPGRLQVAQARAVVEDAVLIQLRTVVDDHAPLVPRHRGQGILDSPGRLVVVATLEQGLTQKQDHASVPGII